MGHSLDMVGRRALVLLIVLAVAAGACTSRGSDPTVTSGVPTTVGPSTTAPSTSRPTVPVPTFIDANGFNDHTVPVIPTVEEYFALSRTGPSGQSVVKFTIADMTFDPQISWMDSNFYTLHDEWYWYRLLNGAAVPGSSFVPHPGGQRFTSIREIYDWARALPASALPYDLQFVGSQTVGVRLYSDKFYELALETEPRVFGPGSLLHFPTSTNGGGERWVIELEYSDAPTPAEVERFFEMIAASVPEKIGANLEWVVRSPVQEQLARTMEAAQLPYHDRVVRYRELVPPGQIAVYNEGIAAGRLLIVGPGGKDITDATDTDIVLIENVPDFLPPASALITSSPQTALAHVNILARNRGIPNASQAGILSDAGVQQAARVRAPALVRASGTSTLEIVLISEDQYELWRELTSVSPISVPAVNVGTLPYLVRLDTLGEIDTERELETWRPIIGGKASGFINMLAAPGITLPPDPVAITVRAYFEHLASVQPTLDAMLADSNFAASRRARYLLLEGRAAFDQLYTEAADAEFADSFSLANPRGTPIGDILAAGGFPNYLRSAPIAAAALAAIESDLRAAYADYSLSQGLRFRSSSSVEDIEGFNGAGLYDSNTGFLRPDLQLDNDDQEKSVEWALKATWASYWGFEAYEERHRERVDHRSGGMAVLVHPRFDDPLELANGVFTFTIEPEVSPNRFSMVINVQHGDVSVTNPDPALGAVAEVIEVAQSDAGAPVVERIRGSNLTDPGVQVLDDSQALELFNQGRAVAQVWIDRLNGDLDPAHEISTLTLDFEFKEMDAGWPAYRRGIASEPSRLVIKQARTLEPGLRHVPADIAALPIPHDVLARARLIERVECRTADSAVVVAIEVLTDPLIAPDVGYGVEPHLVAADPGFVDAVNDACEREILFSTPDQYLIELLEAGELLNLSR